MYTFSSIDQTARLIYTMTLRSNGMIATGEYAAGVAWSNRFLLLDVFKGNNIDGILTRIYNTEIDCIDIEIYSYIGKYKFHLFQVNVFVHIMHLVLGAVATNHNKKLF